MTNDAPAQASVEAVREALRWVDRNIVTAKQAMKESAALGNGYANFAAHDAHKNLTTIKAALETLPPPTVGAEDEAVAWDIQGSEKWCGEHVITRAPSIRDRWAAAPERYGIAIVPFYTRPAPAAVESAQEDVRQAIAVARDAIDAFENEMADDAEREGRPDLWDQTVDFPIVHLRALIRASLATDKEG